MLTIKTNAFTKITIHWRLLLMLMTEADKADMDVDEGA